MSSRTTLDKSDEGKEIVDSEGDTVGMVAEVEGSIAHVTPDPGITDKVRTKLGWDTKDQDTFVLESDSIQMVTDDEVHLK